MNKINATVHFDVPFSCCRDCKQPDLERTGHYAEGFMYYVGFRCCNFDICENAIQLFREQLLGELREMEKDAEERPECQLKAAPLIREIIQRFEAAEKK